jgi:hypothetical protein
MSSRPEVPRKPAKASFDTLYDRPHPARYFSALRLLEYNIPAYAQPVIEQCVSALAELRGKSQVRLLDLCSGYGVNGALLKHDVSMEDLYELYDDSGPNPNLARRISRDCDFLKDRRRFDRETFVIGQDIAMNALDYAQSVGAVDARIKANLERRSLRSEEADLIAEVDLVTVTGGLSYIGAATFDRVLRAVKQPPWVLFYPLQHTPVCEVRDMIASFGLEIEDGPKPVPQRRFKDERERGAILAETDRATGVQRDWPFGSYLEAKLCLARPDADIRTLPLSRLLPEPPGANEHRAETAA